MLLGGAAVIVVATAVLQALIVTEVARGTVGEKLRLGQLWAKARGRLGAVVGYTVLLILAAAIVITVFFGIIAGIVGGHDHRHGLAVVAGLRRGDVRHLRRRDPRLLSAARPSRSGSSTKLAFVPAAIVLERLADPRRDRAVVDAHARVLLAHPRHPAAGRR